MSFIDYLLAHDPRTSLMHRMLRKFGVDRRLRTIADHAHVTARAADRCASCARRRPARNGLDLNEEPASPPDYCRNANLIAGFAGDAGLNGRPL